MQPEIFENSMAIENLPSEQDTAFPFDATTDQSQLASTKKFSISEHLKVMTKLKVKHLKTQ